MRGFGFVLIYAADFPVTPHSYFHFFRVLTEFSVYLLTSKTESCDDDVEKVGVGVVEELVDKPGSTHSSVVLFFELVYVFGKVPCLTSGASLLSFSLFLGLAYGLR